MFFLKKIVAYFISFATVTRLWLADGIRLSGEWQSAETELS